jgi:hypothetical protein
MVTLSISGGRVTASGEQLVCGDEGGLRVERVEDGLDQQRVRAAVEQAAHLLGVGLLDFVEGDRCERPGRSTSGERDSERFIGPMEPATKRGLSGFFGPGVGRFLRDARRSDVHLVDDVLQAVVGLGDARRGERVGLDDVRAGREVGVVDAADDSGRVSTSRSPLPLRSDGCFGEAVAAEVRLPEA